MKYWYDNISPEGDIILSARVRLARNLAGRIFPAYSTPEQKKETADIIRGTAEGRLGKTVYLDMGGVGDMQAIAMAERRLVSPEFVKRRDGSGLIASDDGILNIMVNEEDHIRIQAIMPGSQINAAYRRAREAEAALGAGLDYAYDHQLGYLTHCPTNLGTAMRASAMLHIPFIIKSGLDSLAANAAKVGLTVRGGYGEGTGADGGLVQISNRITIGVSEEEIIERLESAAEKIAEREQGLRGAVYESNRGALEDRVWRALGTLKHARLLTAGEAAELLSEIRLGISLGILPAEYRRGLMRLTSEIQPACISAAAKEELAPQARDAARASITRDYFNNL